MSRLHGDPLRKVQPGQPLRIGARAWNRVLDTIKPNVGFMSLQDGLQPAPNTVYIRNKSGYDVPRFGVLGISGIEIDPAKDDYAHELEFARQPVLHGTTPEPQHSDKFVICLQPIRDDAIGLAAIGGVLACKVELTKASHKFATAKSGDRTQLQSSAKCGAVRLVWVEGQPTGPTGPTAPTGENKWAVGVM